MIFSNWSGLTWLLAVYLGVILYDLVGGNLQYLGWIYGGSYLGFLLR